ncbi:MAG: hypothetical protein QXN55_02220 [Candidatus Nitrosotenuis sp.]
MTEKEFPLNADPDYLIAKFNECLSELNRLANPTDLEKLLQKFGSSNEFALLEISKRIRNLLKVGYKDGEKRSQDFTIEGGKFYHGLQNQLIPHKTNLTNQQSRFLQNVEWHRIKVKEYIDELKLYSEILKPDKTKEVTKESSNIVPTHDQTIVSSLNFYKNEYLRLKNTKNDEEEHQVSSNFSAFMQKITLSQADRISLENNVTYLHNLIFDLLVAKLDHPESVNTIKWRKTINEAYDKVIGSIDFVLKNPHRLEYRKPLSKKENFFATILKRNKQTKYYEKIYSSNEQYDVYKDLKNIVQSAKNEVFVVDGFVDEDLYELYLDSIPNSIPVKILTKNPSQKFIKIGEKLSKKRVLQIREDGQVHDRFIFVDNRCWMIGASIKDAGKRPTVLVEIKSRDSLHNIWKQIFDNAKVLL